MDHPLGREGELRLEGTGYAGPVQVDFRPASSDLDEALVTESDGQKSNIWLKGPYQRYDIVNANDRKYPENLWEELLRSDRYQEAVDNGWLLGRITHPEDGKLNPENASHLTKNLEKRSNGIIYGESIVLDTPAGNTLQALIDGGWNPGISSRGYGDSSMQEGVEMMEEGFLLHGFDVVQSPSAGTYPEGVQESTNEQVRGWNEEDSKEVTEGISYSSILEHVENNLDMDSDKFESFMEKMNRAIEGNTSVENDSDDFSDMISSVQEQSEELATLREENSTLKERVAELEAMVETLIDENDELSEKNQELQEDTNISEVEQELRETKAENAKLRKIAEEALEEGAEILEEKESVEEDLDTAKQVIQEFKNQIDKSDVREAREAVIRQLPSGQRESFRPILERCETLDEVREVANSLESVTGTSDPTLPSRNEVTENTVSKNDPKKYMERNDDESNKTLQEEEDEGARLAKGVAAHMDAGSRRTNGNA